MSSSVSLREQAAMVGAYRWVELRLFEILGGWVADESSGEARLFFDVHSQQHAWHAQLFLDRLPLLDGVDRDVLTVAPSPTVERFVENVEKTDGSAARTAVLARCALPRLVTAYDLHLQRASPVADAPLIRALQLVVGDEARALRKAEALYEAMIGSADVPDEATGRVGHVEEPLLGVGPGLGFWSSDQSLRA
jgi:hypothetical protein